MNNHHHRRRYHRHHHHYRYSTIRCINHTPTVYSSESLGSPSFRASTTLNISYLCGGILSSKSPCHRPSQFLLKLARSFICNGMGYHTSPSSAITPPRVVLYASLHSRKPGEPRTNSITSRCSANEPALLHRSLFSGRRGGPEKAAEIQPNCRHEND